jgi:hypothetical protein
MTPLKVAKKFYGQGRLVGWLLNGHPYCINCIGWH